MFNLWTSRIQNCWYKPKTVDSAWVNYDGNLEYRKNESGALEYRNHSYGDWVKISDNTYSRTCATCGYVIESHLSNTDWLYFNDSQEVKYDENGNPTYRNHSYSNYVLCNDGYEYSQCSSCGHVDKQQHTTHHYSDPHVSYINNGEDTHLVYTYRYCNDCGKVYELYETNNCSFGKWHTDSTGDQFRECNNCGHVQMRAKTLTLGNNNQLFPFFISIINLEEQ